MIEKTLHTGFILFTLMMIGLYAISKGMITEKTRSQLSDLLVRIILPANIINSFLTGEALTLETLQKYFLMMLISTVIIALALFVAYLLYRHSSKERYGVYRYGLMISNSSFVGIPILSTVLGEATIPYLAMFQVPIRLATWTIGVRCFDREGKMSIKRALLHPCVLAIFISFILMTGFIPLPAFAYDSISYVSKTSVFLSMFVIGAHLKELKLKDFLDLEAILFSFVRLIAFPVLVTVILKLCQVDVFIAAINVLIAAMPIATTTVIVAEKYGGDAVFASKIMCLTTILSTVTIPIAYYLFELIYYI